MTPVLTKYKINCLTKSHRELKLIKMEQCLDQFTFMTSYKTRLTQTLEVAVRRFSSKQVFLKFLQY